MWFRDKDELSRFGIIILLLVGVLYLVVQYSGIAIIISIISASSFFIWCIGYQIHKWYKHDRYT